MDDPVGLCQDLWRAARALTFPEHRVTVCISTIDADGFPNARFVDLREVTDQDFIFCTHLNSPKALSIVRNAKVALAAFWEHVSTQIRVQGLCTQLTDHEADAYWAVRPRDAQIVTLTTAQSRPLADLDTLPREFARLSAGTASGPIPRPAHWGGFRLRPARVEILELRKDRLHVRTLYSRVQSGWSRDLLQP